MNPVFENIFGVVNGTEFKEFREPEMEMMTMTGTETDETFTWTETEEASKIKTEKIIIKRMDEVISWDALCFYMRKITIIESDQWEGFL